MSNSKRYESIDTIRIFSGLLVILSHYTNAFCGTSLNWIFENVGGGTGKYGVSLFFFISGFLVANSLKKENNLKVFCLKKYARIEIPYLSAYLILSLFLILASVIHTKYFSMTPLSLIITDKGSWVNFVPVLFALDGILNSHFATHFAFFIGEWFIGTILLIYFISPILYITIDRFGEIKGFCVFILLSVVVFYAIEGYINRPSWFFICRIPEFILGIVVYRKMDVFIRYKKQLILCLFFLLTVISLFLLQKYGYQIRGNTFIPDEPRAFLFTIPALLLTYYFSEYLNNKLNLTGLNSYSKYLYVMMLTQHVIIYRLMEIFPTRNLSFFGFVFVFCLIVAITLAVSKFIFSISQPIEEYVYRNFILTVKKS